MDITELLLNGEKSNHHYHQFLQILINCNKTFKTIIQEWTGITKLTIQGRKGKKKTTLRTNSTLLNFPKQLEKITSREK